MKNKREIEDYPQKIRSCKGLYINLEQRKNRKRLLAKNIADEFCNSQLIRLYQGRSGAAGYVLWPSGAKKLLKEINKGIGIANKFINQNYSLKAYQIEPAAIIQLDQCELHAIHSPLEVKSSIIKNTDSSSTKKRIGLLIKIYNRRTSN